MKMTDVALAHFHLQRVSLVCVEKRHSHCTIHLLVIPLRLDSINLGSAQVLTSKADVICNLQLRGTSKILDRVDTFHSFSSGFPVIRLNLSGF